MRAAALFSLALLATLPAFAAVRPHLDPPDFLTLTASLDRPPEIGVPVDLVIRPGVQEAEALDVTVEVDAPAGMRVLEGARRQAHRIARGAAAPFHVRLIADRPIGRGHVRVVAHAPFPSEALRRWFLRRAPLYGARARRELKALLRDHPDDFVANEVVDFSTTPEEASLGTGPPPPVYLGENGLPFAFETIDCEDAPGTALAWRELLLALDGKTLADPGGWCRLHRMALAQLQEGRVLAAVAVWKAMLARLPASAAFAAHRDALEENLAAALAEAGNAAEARALWDKIALLHPSAHMHVNRATTLDRDGDRAGAAAEYRAALSASPGYTLARRRLEQLRVR